MIVAALFRAVVGLVLLSGILSSQQRPRGVDALVPPTPTPASFVADVAGVLTDDGHRAADAAIRGIQAEGLGDIGVAILPGIGDYPPVEVGVAIYRAWGVGSVAAIGSAQRDVGALLLVVPKELSPDGTGHCWISTGTGAEGILTDGVVAAICRDDLVPHLRERAYDTAILAGIEALGARLRADEGLAAADGPASVPDGSGRGWLWLLLGGLSGGGGVVALRRWRRNRPRPCPDCGHRMVRLDEATDDASLTAGQQTEERLRSVDYDVWQCPCGGELVIPYRTIFTKYAACRACGHRTAWSRQRVLLPPSTLTTGLAEARWRCEACPERWVEQVVLPRVTSSSSGSSGGSSSGGSSFGGSGSTSGGGGGSRY